MKILPYPWQHPHYDRDSDDSLVDKLTFCMARCKEARLAGLNSAVMAWDQEMLYFMPQIVKALKLRENNGFNVGGPL